MIQKATIIFGGVEVDSQGGQVHLGDVSRLRRCGNDMPCSFLAPKRMQGGKVTGGEACLKQSFVGSLSA